MARIGRALEVLHVATHACRGVQRVVVVDVAIGAGPRRHGVHAGEGEAGIVVIKGRIRPGVGIVTLVAGLRETCRDVVGIGCALEVRQVAAHACRGADRIVIVDVTIRALAGRHCVHSRQRESSRGVVERRLHPGAGAVVARLASLRETRGNVVRIRGALEILQVTSYAGRAAQGVVAVDVAIGALARGHCMHSGQREAGRGVIELSVAPLHYVVALFTRCRKAAVGHRCGRAGEILLVATEARYCPESEIVIHMAVGALTGRNRVSPGKNESGCAVVKVTELGVQPVVGAVAGIACGRKFRGNVVRVRASRKVRQVAGGACGRHRLECAGGAVFVASIAVDGSVGAGQREAIVVLLNVFNRDLPSPHGVALLAVGAQLPLVNIGMAILAA